MLNFNSKLLVITRGYSPSEAEEMNSAGPGLFYMCWCFSGIGGIEVKIKKIMFNDGKFSYVSQKFELCWALWFLTWLVDS